MTKRIVVIATVALLVAATAFAAPSDQTGNQNWWDQMYQYCTQTMQQWGGSSPNPQGGQAQPQGQTMSYNGGMMMGGMMGNGNYGNAMGNMMNSMMGNGNSGNMMGGMMGNGNYGNMMGSVDFR